MADEKKEAKPTPLSIFRAKVREAGINESTLVEGLKSTNAKVRAYATKLAVRSQEFPFVKKNIMPLIKTEKTKRVLASLSKHVTREELTKRVSDIVKELKAKLPAKEEKKEEAPPA